MKKIFLLTIFITVGLRAQFNYQAIVKDNNGDIISRRLIHKQNNLINELYNRILALEKKISE